MDRSRGAFTAQISRKRKERDDQFLHSFKNKNHLHVKGKQVQSHSPHPNTTSLKSKPGEPVCSNRLLAGYMAHEFLTKGTLLGQKFDPAPARAQAFPLSAPGAEPKKQPTSHTPPVTVTNGDPMDEASAAMRKIKSYAEVANLLKTDGVHIPGIVNPTQLARWIQM